MGAGAAEAITLTGESMLTVPVPSTPGVGLAAVRSETSASTVTVPTPLTPGFGIELLIETVGVSSVASPDADAPGSGVLDERVLATAAITIPTLGSTEALDRMSTAGLIVTVPSPDASGPGVEVPITVAGVGRVAAPVGVACGTGDEIAPRVCVFNRGSP